MNGASENGSWLNLSGAPISVTTGPSSTKALSFAGSQVSASAPVSLDLGGVLHLNGTLTLTKGGVSSVDLNTGLDADSGVLSQIKNVAVAASDPTNGTDVRRSEDFSKLWNLQVSDAAVRFHERQRLHRRRVQLGRRQHRRGHAAVRDRARALGLFAGGINLTFLMLTPLGGMPIPEALPGLKGYIGEVGLTGLEHYLVLTAKNVEFGANLGTPLETDLAATSTAVVDWVSSFPDPEHLRHPDRRFGEPDAARLPRVHRWDEPPGRSCWTHRLGHRGQRRPGRHLSISQFVLHLGRLQLHQRRPQPPSTSTRMASAPPSRAASPAPFPAPRSTEEPGRTAASPQRRRQHRSSTSRSPPSCSACRTRASSSVTTPAGSTSGPTTCSSRRAT